MVITRNNNSLHSQIVAAIQADIFTNREVGDKLPSESEYADTFGVTRTTVQKALKDIADMNLIDKVQGKGSFVTMKQPRVKLFNFKGFSDYARQIGAEPVTKLVSKEINNIHGRPYLTLRRLRSIKNQNGLIPLTLDQSVLDLTSFKDLNRFDFEKNSLYETLRGEYNVFPATTTLRMSAIAATKDEIDLLDCGLNAALLQADGVVFDTNNNIVESVKVIYSEHAEFKLTLGI